MTEEHKKNISVALKGRKLTKEWKKKISDAHKGLPGTNKGKHFSIEHKRKISEANKGKKRSIKTCRKIGLSRIGKVGKHAPNWKHGLSKTKYYISEKNKQWAIDNYEKKLFHVKHRRILKNKSSGSHTLNEWKNLKETYNWICLCCNKSEPEITLSEDHIVPLTQDGSDDIENIQPLCRSCNSIKHTKIINYIAQSL